MSGFTSAFAELYAVQTAELGVAILATVTGYGTNKEALLSGVDQGDSFGAGTTALPSNSYLLQIIGTDLSARPPNGTQVTCNGSATGLTLQVTRANLVNGIWEIQVGDIQGQ